MQVRTDAERRRRVGCRGAGPERQVHATGVAAKSM
jgi:hypothetical protein